MQKYIEKYKKLPVQVKASLWFLICSFFQKGISVISTPIFTRLLSSSEYGQFVTFNSWYSIVYVIVSMNLASGVYTAAMVKHSEERNILASSYQGLTLCLSTVWIALCLIFREFWSGFFSLTPVQILGMGIMVWTSAAFALWAIEQRVCLNYKRLVLLTIIVSVAKPVVGIMLVLGSDDKVTARIMGLAGVELVGYTGVAVSQMIRGKKLFSKKYWLHALKFNVPLIPHALSQSVLSGADRIMIKNMVGDSQAGYYGLAYSVSSLMLIFNTSLSQTLAPWTYQKLKSDKTEEINPIAIFTIVGVGFINVLFMTIAPEMISIFAPKEYSEAVYVVPPIAMSVFFMYLFDWFVRIEYYYEKSLYILFASVTGAVLNIILNYLLIPVFGYIVAGYTTAVCYGVYSFMHYFFMRKICRAKMEGKNVYDIRKIAIISILFVIFGIGINMTYRNSMIRYSCLLILLVLVFVFRKKIVGVVRKIMSIRKSKT